VLADKQVIADGFLISGRSCGSYTCKLIPPCNSNFQV